MSAYDNHEIILEGFIQKQRGNGKWHKRYVILFGGQSPTLIWAANKKKGIQLDPKEDLSKMLPMQDVIRPPSVMNRMDKTFILNSKDRRIIFKAADAHDLDHWVTDLNHAYEVEEKKRLKNAAKKARKEEKKMLAAGVPRKSAPASRLKIDTHAGKKDGPRMSAPAANRPSSPGKAWTCQECYANNDFSKSKCIDCRAKNPNAPKKKKWPCNTCEFKNLSTRKSCSMCRTPKE